MKGFLLIDPCGLHPTQEVQPYSLRQSLISPYMGTQPL